MRQYKGWLLLIALSVALLAGCKHTACRAPVAVVPPCTGCGQAVTSGASPRYPPPVTAAPIGPTMVTPGMGSMPLPPGQPLPAIGQPAPPPPVVVPAVPPASQQSSARLQTPREDEVKPAGGTGGATEIPNDIPQFNQVFDQVATGLHPFPEGYVWLQKKGYRTILVLRQPGEDESTMRQTIEKLGMKYLSLELAPAKLNREQFNQFSSIIRDSATYPLFVSDRKGTLAGALWYLHFRLVEKMPDAQAKARAQRLGLVEPTDNDPDLVELWQAIQSVLKAT